ncbi:hypothetical protein C2W59_01097 [Bacillus pumilus]|uniref:Uncharacterized protein n=1 Tax=Bacillus pumilus TaxID=1408 RepID=A0AB34QZB0_BACPU|nr:hypothetical protein B4127_4044 [Bacillus pumilus]RAP09339.1 hypothetical protein C2W58_00632 [Bacillus pumilus]RAP19317.1 hypothetical protein C2W59_01097 [Bacillus pumilus]
MVSSSILMKVGNIDGFFTEAFWANQTKGDGTNGKRKISSYLL